jgi:hypothetical protein
LATPPSNGGGILGMMGSHSSFFKQNLNKSFYFAFYLK